MTHRLLLMLLATVTLLGTVAVADPTDLFDALLQRPARSGTVIVPDRFLRQWDPVLGWAEEGTAGVAAGEASEESWRRSLQRAGQAVFACGAALRARGAA